MSLVLDDARRGSDPLLSRLRELTDVVAQQNATIAALRIERDTVRSEHEAAQAEVEKLRLLIRQLQRGRFGRRSEKLDPDQLQLGLEDLEQTVAAAEEARRSYRCGCGGGSRRGPPRAVRPAGGPSATPGPSARAVGLPGTAGRRRAAGAS